MLHLSSPLSFTKQLLYILLFELAQQSLEEVFTIIIFYFTGVETEAQ